MENRFGVHTLRFLVHPSDGSLIRDVASLPFTERLELCGNCHGRGSSIDADGVSAGQYGYPYSEIHGRGYRVTDNVAECSDCHVPFTAKTVNHFDIRSHTFKIIAPDMTVRGGGDPAGLSGPKDTSHVPNSCNSSSCHDGSGDGPSKNNTIAQLGLNYLRSLNGTAVKGDTDADGDVDFVDFSEFTKSWLQEAGWHVPE